MGHRRNSLWIERNPWFEQELLPVLLARLAKVLAARVGAMTRAQSP